MKSPFIPLPFLSGPSPSFNPPLPLQFTLFLMLILSSSLPLSYYLFFSLVITHFLLLYLLSYFLSFSLFLFPSILLSYSHFHTLFLYFHQVQLCTNFFLMQNPAWLSSQVRVKLLRYWPGIFTVNWNWRMLAGIGRYTSIYAYIVHFYLCLYIYLCEVSRINVNSR